MRMLNKGSEFISVFFDEDLITYFTSFKIEDGFLIIHNGNKYLYTDMRYYNSAKNLAKASVELIQSSLYDSLNEFIKNYDITTVGIVNSLTSTANYLLVKLTGVAVTDIETEVTDMRSVKTETEISLIKRAHKIAEKSFNETLKIITEGVTEKEIAAYLEYRFKVNGADGPSFDTIVAFNENSAIPHYKTGDTKLKLNSVILIDFGCKVEGYCSDTTRTFFYGNEPSNEFKSVYNEVLKAHNLAFNFIKNGTLGVDAHKASENHLKTVGLSKYFTHGLGHGVGVKIHEAPRLSKKSESVLTSGNCFSIEPGVYIENKFGVRIEDTVYLSNDELTSFNELTKELFTVKP